MKDIFIRYVIFAYQDIPTSVYEGFISLFCLGLIALIAIKGLAKGLKSSSKLLAIEYILFIFCTTVFFRPSVDVFIYNFIPFWSYEAIDKGRNNLLAENILNVVVFVPIGLFSCVSRRLKWWMVLLIGFGISLLIELLQFVMKRGFSEADDVIHNTLGCAIGIMIVEIIKGVWKFCAFLFVPHGAGIRRMQEFRNQEIKDLRI